MPGPGRSRVIASVNINPKHSSRTQKPVPGETLTTLLPKGVSASPAAPMVSVMAAIPTTETARRTRAL